MHRNLVLESVMMGGAFVAALTGAGPKEADSAPNKHIAAEPAGAREVHAAATNSVSLTADMALKYAIWYVSSDLTPVDPHVSAKQAADGAWKVTFGPGFVEDPGGGGGYAPLGDWSLQVRITPDGWCWAAGVKSSPMERVEPGYITSTDSAILLARLYAVRHGLIRSKTVVEQVQMEDGGWLIGFEPGTLRVAQEDPAASKGFPISIIRVDPKGQCSVFLGPAEDERRTTGRLPENVKIDVSRIEMLPPDSAE